MVNFVQRLRDTPQLRVLRLVRQASSYVHISLALWEPLDLKGMLEKIPGVTNVTLAPLTQWNEAEPLFMVRLGE